MEIDMKFIWAKNGYTKNTRLTFKLELSQPADKLTVCAADFFRVFIDGKFVSYGPERSAAGYTRKRDIPINGAKSIRVDVAGYNQPSYSSDLQEPFFGAEVEYCGKTVYTADDFSCVRLHEIDEKMPKYTAQRGFMEHSDLRKRGETTEECIEVAAPVIIPGNGDCAAYPVSSFSKIGEGDFHGFEKVSPDVGWDKNPRFAPTPDLFNVEKELIEEVKSGYRYVDYVLPKEYTGFLQFEIDARTETKFFIAFEEILVEGDWVYRRTAGQDAFVVDAPKGKSSFLAFEPYAMRLLKIIYKGDAEFTPTLIRLENSKADCVTVKSTEKFEKVFEAARNTFKQNALDIFMDCPGRERSGWLCDSYFTAKAERLFTGNNNIEKVFLENFILARPLDGACGMLPMNFPASHEKGLYIPNWAMWFVVELGDYLKRTGDTDLVMKAKDKVYAVKEFLDKYINEDGLLENLESWVFIEWSICNSKDYVAGVNYPSNILYSEMLKTMSELYGDAELGTRAEKMRKKILEQSYDGSFFADNAVRDGRGALVRCDSHLSETCQYYALFFGLITEESYVRKMVTEFGPLRSAKAYPEIGRSNMFIGNYLRFLWLCEIGEYKRVVDESLEYFSKMAEGTGTLWESDSSYYSSFNHGFASVAAMLLLRCTVGYLTVNGGKPVLIEDFKNDTGVDVEAVFNYA